MCARISLFPYLLCIHRWPVIGPTGRRRHPLQKIKRVRYRGRRLGTFQKDQKLLFRVTLRLRLRLWSHVLQIIPHVTLSNSHLRLFSWLKSSLISLCSPTLCQSRFRSRFVFFQTSTQLGNIKTQTGSSNPEIYGRYWSLTYVRQRSFPLNENPFLEEKSSPFKGMFWLPTPENRSLWGVSNPFI